MNKIQDFGAMQIEYWPLSRPKPYPKNARKWSAKAVEKVAMSIREFGWRQPIVVDASDVIIIGHLRLASATLLQGRGELAGGNVPVHIARDLSPAKVRALRLADNRTHDEADWDEGILREEMLDLKGLDLDLSLTGFDSRELDAFLRVDREDEDDVPPVPETPVSKLGDLWLLGSHRLLCGDSTDAGEVSRLLGGQDAPFLMVTDPPYGVDYDPEWRLDSGLNKSWQTRAEGLVTNDNQCDWTKAWRQFPGDVLYIWHSALHSSEVANGLNGSGFDVRAQIVWVKTSLVIGRGAYHWQHEPCWYGVRHSRKANWLGDRKQSTVWQVPNMHRTQGDVDDGHTSHSTQKPVEVMRRPILNHTAAGDAVYDPFLGSGTTIIAAESTARRCFGLELEPKYCDVIVQRWTKFTGCEATLASHKTTFAQTKEGRLREWEDAVKEECLTTLETNAQG